MAQAAAATVDDTQKKDKSRKRSKKILDQIRRQMEFYFDDSNMAKDRFLKKLIDETSDGFVELETFMSFNKIRTLGCEDVATIIKSLKSSKMLSVSEDGLRVKRVTPVRNLDDLDDRTIYVEGLPANADHNWVTQTFSGYGRVSYVSLPRYRSTKDLKGFGFVEFATLEAARLAVEKLKADDAEKVTCFPKAGSKDMQRLEKQAYGLEPVEEPMACEVKAVKKRARSDSESESEDWKKKKIKTEPDSSEHESEKVKADDKKKIKTEPDSSELESEKVKADDKKGKKRKRSDAGSESSAIKVKKENSPLKSILKSAKSDSETEDVKKSVTMETAEKKKHRKQKKKGKEEKKKSDLKLKVLSKREWLLLRGQYLAAQKSRLSALKKTLHKANEPEVIIKPKKEVKSPAKKVKMEIPSDARYEYQPDVIVRVKSELAPLHRKSLKEQLSGGTGIAYIDLNEGSLTCYVRCKDKESSKQVLQTDISGMDLTLIQGEDEKIYWQKMNEDREKKLSQPKRGKKKRGEQKIKDKAERVTMTTKEKMTSSPPQKHVYFDN